MPDPYPATPVLCEPAQSKCTWTCQKRHLCGNLRGKCRTLLPRPAFCASLRSRNTHGGNLRGKMPNAPDTTLIEHRALTPTVRTPQCGHTVWGTFGFPKQKRPDPGPPLDCSVLSNPLESGWSLQPSHPYAEVSRLLHNRCSRLR